jgi:hypothetical protein
MDGGAPPPGPILPLSAAPPPPRPDYQQTGRLDPETVLSNPDLSRYGYRTAAPPTSSPVSPMDKSTPDFWTAADKAMLGLCETLALLFGLPFGEDLYNDKPVTGLHGFYLAIGLLFAVAGPMWPWIRTRPWVSQTLVASLSRVPSNPYVWFTILMVLFLYGAGPDIYRRATQLPPTPAPSVQTGFGFQPVAPQSVPSKNYSATEKQELLGLIGTLSTLLNDEGLPAAQTARVTGYTPVTPSKDGLDDAVKKAESVRDSLAKIQLTIWQNILQPKNSNYLADLNYIVDANGKFYQFQTATEQFLNNVTNFERNLDSFSPDQRNWITSLIQTGIGQNWGRAAEEFRGYVEQCDTRMNTEREALK